VERTTSLAWWSVPLGQGPRAAEGFIRRLKSGGNDSLVLAGFCISVIKGPKAQGDRNQWPGKAYVFAESAAWKIAFENADFGRSIWLGLVSSIRGIGQCDR